MPDIKIFVSHRIDINSELIDNPLYVPMRCGAVFDDENPMEIMGDDTGDNISERRMSFCEFTVQYWAWKNVDADYYGLCHYRRYLSFAGKRFHTDEFNMIHVPVLTPGCKQKYSLLSAAEMEREISGYDMILSEYADVKKIPTPKGKQKTVHDLWMAHDGVFFEKKAIDLMFRLIDELAPQYSQSAREYFSGARHRGFNCYVMKKELFARLCEFQFPIMFELERRLDTTGYTQTMLRTPAFIGEMLYGIFTYHVTTYEAVDTAEKQLIFFSDTEKISGLTDYWRRCTWAYVDRGLRFMVDPVMPKGSRRREAVKNIFYSITPARRRGIADIKKK